MTNAIAEVAQRIRALRESCDVSVEEMAQCTGVTVEAYNQLEAGETDFTFTFIYKCASRLGACRPCNVHYVAAVSAVNNGTYQRIFFI